MEIQFQVNVSSVFVGDEVGIAKDCQKFLDINEVIGKEISVISKEYCLQRCFAVFVLWGSGLWLTYELKIFEEISLQMHSLSWARTFQINADVNCIWEIVRP